MSGIHSTTTPRLSVRGGTMILRGVALFLQGVRNHRRFSPDPAITGKPGKGRKKMSEKDGFKCSPKLMETIKRETMLNRNEIEALYKIYMKLVGFSTASSRANAKLKSSSVISSSATTHEGIDRIVFREVLHNTFDIITENMLMDRIFCVWDKQNYGVITLENWFYGMAMYLKGNMAKQIEFCFAVYDLNADGFVTKEEMFQLLRNCLMKVPQDEDPDESVKDLVDIVMKKIDKDKDGKISLQDYKDTVAEEPLLLEAFGRCLPSERSRTTFLTTLKQ